jgi:two-component sensor histidine kinase
MVSEMNERLGILYLDQNFFELAESSFLAALTNQGTNEIPKSQISIYAKLAILASRRNEIQLADYYLQTASPYLEADISDIHKATYYQAEGRVALSKGHWEASIKAYQRIAQIGKKTGNEQLRLNGYAGLGEAYRKSGEYKTALIYGDSLNQLNKNLDLAFQNRTMLDLKQKYEANIKNEEIAKLNAMQNVQALELNQKHKLLMFSLIGLFLAIAALAGFVYALITKSRSHQVLTEKNNQLREALDNNKMLIKEIHHRVKNNLQVVSSLLNLQSRFETDGTVMRAINTSKNRVQSMSLLHQHLYLNEDLNSIKVKKYFEDLTSFLVKGYPLNGKEIILEMDFEDITLDIDTVVPMGLICNELITNALKYAYPDALDCRLWVSIKEANDKIRLIVKDNGIGVSFTQLPEKSTSMGTQLIKSFANKIKASIEIDNFEGTEFKLTFERKAPIQSFNRLTNVAG